MEQTLVMCFAPMFIQEYSNLFRFATDEDAAVFFDLSNVNTTESLVSYDNESRNPRRVRD